MRRSRSSNKSVAETPVVIDQPTMRDRTICEILYWHKFLPSSWIRHHFPSYRKDQSFITRLGTLREEQNAFIKWSDWPLNIRGGTNNRHAIYELAFKGAKLIERRLPIIKGQDVPHDFIISLHECSLKFQARAASETFQFLESSRYKLPSSKDWEPDGHPMLIGDTLFHSEIERRKWKESPEDTEAKLEKAYEYVRERSYKRDAKKALVLFLSTTNGRTNALKQYVAQHFGPTPFFLFATTKDWVSEAPLPDPALPLVPEWERVGHPPMKLFEKEVPNDAEAPQATA